MNIAVFVLGYKGMPFLKSGYLDSIVEASNYIGASAKIIYLDNYSRDGSAQYILDHYSFIDLLVSPKNNLYCKAINSGIQYIYKRYKPKYYLLVDADNPCELDTYLELVSFADKYKDVGLVQPVVKKLSDKNHIYSYGHIYDNDFSCRTLKKLPEDAEHLLDLPSCSISSTLVKSEVFEKIGLLDPVFEIYYESSDLSFRAKAQGYKVACNLNAVAYNEGAVAEDIDSYHERYYRYRNKLIFWKKHDPSIHNQVHRALSQEYSILQQEFHEQPFGLSITKESIRKGIEEGFRICDSIGLYSSIVKIEDYDKSNVILISK